MTSVYLLDDLHIDLARQRVTRAGAPLDVAGLSFKLLRHLLAQGDRVVGFDELIATVWAPAVVNEETVTQRIKLLRQALGDDGRHPRYVRSVRGRGYQLCSVPREAVRIESMAEPPSTASTRWHPPPVAAALALAVVAAIAMAGWAWRAMITQPRTAPAPLGAKAELLQRANYYAGIGQAENNERAIALYEEALRSDANDAVVGIGLSRALSARVCLYNGAPESAARAQQLAEAVIARTPDASAAHDALAYAFDCRGELDAAIGEYEKAIALDPAARVASRASVANLYMVKGRLADALEANVEVERTDMKLRFLDLQIARNLDLLGFTAQAEQRYRKIFRLYPDNVFGNVAYPTFLFTQGRYAEAEAALNEALQRPLHPELFLLAGELALLRGEPARAAEMFGKAAALRPHQSLPRTLLDLYGIPAADDAALAARAETMAGEVNADVPDAWLEVALLRRADHAGAIDALRHAVDAGFRDQAWLRTSPLLRALADKPGFADIVDAVGRAVAAERTRVLAAAWLPPDLVNAKPVVPSG